MATMPTIDACSRCMYSFISQNLHLKPDFMNKERRKKKEERRKRVPDTE
jgi:hypothetical protein